MRFLKLSLTTMLMFLFSISYASAHEIDYDKRLYFETSPGSNLYSKMNIYFVSKDASWWSVPHAHQKFYFGWSTVKNSRLEYFNIWDQDQDIIFQYSGSTKTTDYDNSINTTEHIYKGDNYLRMRVKNLDTYINNSGIKEDYYWYEDTYWENV